MFGGVIERFPNIKFFMVHGGGFTPYQAGRWQHGWHVRPEPKNHLKKPPAETIRTFYWDTILHGQPALEFLVKEFGASHVLLGSDYPYDMGTFECARQVKALGISDLDKADHPQRHDAEAAERREMSGLVSAAAIDGLIRDCDDGGRPAGGGRGACRGTDGRGRPHRRGRARRVPPAAVRAAHQGRRGQSEGRTSRSRRPRRRPRWSTATTAWAIW